MIYKHQLFYTLININILIYFSLYQKIILNIHTTKKYNTIYKIYILTIYHITNTKKNYFRKKTILKTNYIHYKYHFQKKKIYTIPIKFLYITIHIRL